MLVINDSRYPVILMLVVVSDFVLLLRVRAITMPNRFSGNTGES